MTIHCWRCGSPLPHPPPATCEHCGQAHYDNPKPAADAVAVRDGKVLLVRRTRDPWRDHWDIPGGFCDQGEHPLDAAERELREETGYRGRAGALVGLWLDRYPQGPDEPPVTTLNAVYLVALLEDQPTGASDDEVSDTAWFDLGALPPLAFPDHALPALDAVRRLLGQ